jgi:hypothetical protein|tara:strand:+ start:48 stop:368 length:321 start_codon:yes stop_codon:yes gene_type:complete
MKNVDKIDKQIVVWSAGVAIIAIILIVVLGGQIDISQIEPSDSLIGLAYGGDCSLIRENIVSNQAQSQREVQLYQDNGNTKHYIQYLIYLQEAVELDKQLSSCPEV